MVVPDYVSGKSEIQPFFGNLAKCGSGQISSWICWVWQMQAQLQYVQLITDKTNTADLTRDVFTISVSVMRTKNKKKVVAVPQIFYKNWQ